MRQHRSVCSAHAQPCKRQLWGLLYHKDVYKRQGYTLAETENLTGETDTTATANPKTYTGFAFDGTAEGTVCLLYTSRCV